MVRSLTWQRVTADQVELLDRRYPALRDLRQALLLHAHYLGALKADAPGMKLSPSGNKLVLDDGAASGGDEEALSKVRN